MAGQVRKAQGDAAARAVGRSPAAAAAAAALAVLACVHAPAVPATAPASAPEAQRRLHADLLAPATPSLDYCRAALAETQGAAARDFSAAVDAAAAGQKELRAGNPDRALLSLCRALVALETDPLVTAREMLPRVLMELGRASRARGDVERAAAFLRRALEQLRQLKPTTGIGGDETAVDGVSWTAVELAELLAARGEVDAGRDLLLEVAAELSSRGLGAFAAWLRAEAAALLAAAEREEEGAPLLAAAVAQVARGAPGPVRVRVYGLAGQFDEAVKWIGGDPRGGAWLEKIWGERLAAQGDATGAMAHLRRAEQLALAAGDPVGAGDAELRLGALELAGDVAAAEKTFEAAFSRFREGGDARGARRARLAQGRAREAAGDGGSAERAYKDVLTEAALEGDADGVAAARDHLARVAESRGDWSLARAEHDAALDLLARGTDHEAYGRALTAAARSAHRSGDPGRARELLLRAVDAAPPGSRARADANALLRELSR